MVLLDSDRPCRPDPSAAVASPTAPAPSRERLVKIICLAVSSQTIARRLVSTYPFRGGTSAQKPAPAMTLALFDGFTLTKKEFWLLRLGDFGPPEVVWALPVASPCWSDAIPTP